MSVSRFRSATVSAHEDVQCARAKQAFYQLRGLEAFIERTRQIAALDSKDWRGKDGMGKPTRVYKLTCFGTRGKGQHEKWEPERILWSLIDLRAFRCPHHFGD